MDKNTADRILRRITVINAIITAGSKVTVTPDGNDGAEVCELNFAQLNAIMFGLDDIVDEVRKAAETPEEREARELVEEEERIYWQGLGIG